MKYRVSRARREFETQLQLATRELAPLYKLARKQGGGSRLLAAYYVFAYSLLENYIKNLVEDSLNTLHTLPPAFDQWPDLMLGYFLHKSENLAADYRRYGVDEDEAVILKKVGQIARKIASWSTGTTRPISSNASDFLDKKKYPSPKNLPQLFRRLGVEEIWALVGREGRMNGKMILTSLNDLRTGIAHEGRVPPEFNLTDYRNRIDQMHSFVAALDRGISSHFCSRAISRAAWNGAMI